MKSRRGFVVAVAAGALVVGSGAAFAAWTKSSSGTGMAASGSLSAPGAPALKSGGSITATSIPLEWSAAAAGSATVKYWVERSDFGGSTWADACGTTQNAPITALNCTDSGLPSSHDYQYRVTAIAGSWGNTGGTSGKLSTSAAPATPLTATLSGTRANVTNSWTPTAIIQLSPIVQGAAVSGSWSVTGTSTTSSCTTDATGKCSVTTTLGNNTGSDTFTLESVTATGYSYTASTPKQFVTVNKSSGTVYTTGP